MGRTDSGNQKQPDSAWDRFFRHLLAIAIVLLAIISITVLATLAISQATSSEKSETIRFVFVSTLPLFGTWVGAIIAFYFARENLREATSSAEALSKATAGLAGVWNPSTLVDEAMQPFNRIERYQLKREGDPPTLETVDSVKLKELWSRLSDRPFDRLPLLDEKDVAQALMTREWLNEWAAHQSGTTPNVFADHTIADLETDTDKRNARLKNFETVASGVTLAVAREKLGSGVGCSTVLVTSDGTKAGALRGILTSTDLAKLGS